MDVQLNQLSQLFYNLGAVLLKRAETETFSNAEEKAVVVERAIKYLEKASKSQDKVAVDSTYLMGQAYLMHPTLPAAKKYKQAIYKGFWRFAYVLPNETKIKKVGKKEEKINIYKDLIDQARLKECINLAVQTYEKWIKSELEEALTKNPVLPRNKVKHLNQMLQSARRILDDIKDKAKNDAHNRILDKLEKQINQ